MREDDDHEAWFAADPGDRMAPHGRVRQVAYVGRPPPPEPPPAPPVRGRMPRGVVIGGVAVALAGGLAFGLLSRPELDLAEDRPMAPVAASPSRATMPVEVVPPAPVRPPPAATKLEVLPPALADREARPVQRPARPAAAPPPIVAEAPEAPRPAPVVAPVEQPVAAARPAPEPFAAPRPSFDCRFARSPAERMVCGDSNLAALDRSLDRAFRRAVDSGVPYRELRGEQDDWLDIREYAARRSPQAVESIYRQRIAELNEMAR